MVVKIVPNEKANPPRKLADAELHLTDGVLDGLKLIGFAVLRERVAQNGRYESRACAAVRAVPTGNASP